MEFCIYKPRKVDERILTKCEISRASRTRRQRDFIEKNWIWSQTTFNFRYFIIRTPTFSRNGRYVMTYNGEIYNFKEFYPVKSNGFDIKTTSDTGF
jgi:asparagine synthase (glutamine-hydrolysing)